jgi:hypothetical protein
MGYSYDDLKKKTVTELRAIAKETEHEAVKGYTQLNKEHLLEALCKAFNIDKHAHHDVVGVDKSTIKARIKKLKAERSEALQAKDYKQLKFIRRQIHHLKRAIRKATL